MFGNSSKSKPTPERVRFDFRFSENERKQRGITVQQLASTLAYGSVNTVEVTTKDFTRTTITVLAPQNSRKANPHKTEVKEYLSRLSGTIEKSQLRTLKSLFGK